MRLYSTYTTIRAVRCDSETKAKVCIFNNITAKWATELKENMKETVEDKVCALKKQFSMAYLAD